MNEQAECPRGDDCPLTRGAEWCYAGEHGPTKPVSDQARLAEWEALLPVAEKFAPEVVWLAFREVLAALREAERRAEEAEKRSERQGTNVGALYRQRESWRQRAEEAESKLATATDTIRSLTALASEREAT